MDSKLLEAAKLGDVEFLKNAVASYPNPPHNDDYFLSQTTSTNKPYYPIGSNIFHLATFHGWVEFIRKAIKILPTQIVLKLLSQRNEGRWNPLHEATWRNRVEVVREMLGFYRSYSGPPLVPDDINNPLNKPWLALTKSSESDSKTPLHTSIDNNNEESVMEIMSMDQELLCNVLDKDGNSPLFLAVKQGMKEVAESILNSDCSYSLRGGNGSTPLHFAPKTSENVLRLLLEKHPYLINAIDDKGYNVLHQWADLGKDWPLNILLNEEFPSVRIKLFKDLIHMQENQCGDNPLHTAARSNSKIEFVQLLVRGYHIYGEIPESVDWPAPWKKLNKDGNTPLHIALILEHQELALYFISVDPTLCHVFNDKGESPLFIAVSIGCGEVVEEILSMWTQDPNYKMLCRNDGQTILHCLHKCSEKIGRQLLEKFWWMINLRDDKGRTALDEAKEANVQWLVYMLRYPSSIQKEPLNWVTACERGETWAVLAFVDTCHDLTEVCRKQIDTPLHHIKMHTYKDYLNFLKNPSIAELKNTTDYEGATPLHRALQRKNMILAKALLVDNVVERNIEDYHGVTPMDLLAKLCRESNDWAEMCKQIKVNPYLKTTYIQPRTNLDQMRNTLSVVAALLATITFAAGFTLPGGLDSQTGNAMLGKKAAFIVFLLADAYAMCTSMFVLFCLIWSMVSTRDMSSLLIDRSVVILMQSLYGTMVAFMMGIYAVTKHSSLWAAIIIFFMCSSIIILTNKTVLHNVLATLIPASNQEAEGHIQLIEEGTPHTSGDNVS